MISEVVLTYNNSVHSAIELNPFEFDKKNKNKIKFSNEHDYQKKLNEFQETLYSKIKEKLEISVLNRTNKLNKGREDPECWQDNETVYRKNCRRRKITSKFSKRKVKGDHLHTNTTTNNQKIHKSRIKRKRKNFFYGRFNYCTIHRNTRPNKKQGYFTNSSRTSKTGDMLKQFYSCY